MRVIINGMSRSVPEGFGLLDALALEGVPPKAAIVEVNRKFVPQGELASFTLEDGDDVELILPAFGG